MTAKKLRNGLTIKRELFSQCVARADKSAAACYRECYAASGSSDATAQQESSRLLRDPLIAARIDEIVIQIATAAGATRESVIARLVDIGQSGKASGARGEQVRAMELVGKAIDGGIFRDRDVIETPETVADINSEIEELEEQIRLAASDGRKVA